MTKKKPDDEDADVGGGRPAAPSMAGAFHADDVRSAIRDLQIATLRIYASALEDDLVAPMSPTVFEAIERELAETLHRVDVESVRRLRQQLDTLRARHGGSAKR